MVRQRGLQQEGPRVERGAGYDASGAQEASSQQKVENIINNNNNNNNPSSKTFENFQQQEAAISALNAATMNERSSSPASPRLEPQGSGQVLASAPADASCDEAGAANSGKAKRQRKRKKLPASLADKGHLHAGQQAAEPRHTVIECLPLPGQEQPAELASGATGDRQPAEARASTQVEATPTSNTASQNEPPEQKHIAPAPAKPSDQNQCEAQQVCSKLESTPEAEREHFRAPSGDSQQPEAAKANPEAATNNHSPSANSKPSSSATTSPSIGLNRKLIQASGGSSNSSLKIKHKFSGQAEEEETKEVVIGGGEFYCKRRKLSHFQALLLRKWPCLPISIFIMASLMFGILLSILTVYLMHGFTDCSLGYALKASPIDLSLAHESPRRPSDFDVAAPIEAVSSPGLVLTAAPGVRQMSAKLLSDTGSGLNETQLKLAAQQQLKFRRLPSSLWPTHYDLFIQPFIVDPFYFTGKVSIRIRCSERTDNITLHTHDLKIDQSSLSLKLAAGSGANQTEAGDELQVAKVKSLSQDKELQYSIIHLDRDLEVGREYVLGMDFVGNLNDDLAGFYKIKYERQNSSEITWVAATQFQATDARRAFPCFDEPLYKATFSIQIKHWKNMTALSNMPIIDRQDSPDGLWVTDTFEKSHKMSTYLVAFAVTNFESRSEGNISVWTRPGFAHTAEYALKIASKILNHYENFFGIEYPLPKMDMIALPDFNAGAMENWGLITYRETAMLYDETSSSVANKQRVAVVVAHELAHQWFGNLVTPKWWDDLWLNEGFASYVEYIGVDHVEPKWQMLDQFVANEVQNVFKMDSLSSSHQISIPVNNPDEISEIFDHISYSKGSSVIRMMSHFLTEDLFKAGLRTYLRTLKYSNAEQKDLWAHLTEAQRLANVSKVIDVEQVMNSWTLQTGYPLVTLTRAYDGTKGAKLDQTRYRTNMNAKLPSSANETRLQKWEIPITFTSKSESNWSSLTRFWLHQNDTGAVQLNSLPVEKEEEDWVLLNLNQVGYYRVNYDLKNWKLIINQLNEDHTKISAVNRAQLLDDMFELARSGLLDYKFVMDASKYIKKELDYLPFETMFTSIAYIDDMLQRTPIYGEWRDYLVQLLTPYYNRYKDSDWTISAGKSMQRMINSTALTAQNQQLNPMADPNDLLAQYNQINAIAWGCQVEPHCIKKAKDLFQEWKSTGKNIINPALRYTVYCRSIENGSKDDWNFLWKVYTKEQNASEKDRILRALACSKELWILSRYLEWTFDKTKPIRRQDGAFVFRSISRNDYGRDLSFNFMRERWTTIKESYGKTSFSMGHLIRSISSAMNTNTELIQLKAFYEIIKNDVGTGKRAFQIAIEEVEANIAWRDRSYKILENWLTNANQNNNIKSGATSSV